MNNYNRDRRPRRRDSGGRGDYSRPEMFDAVCDECGRKCKVPFKPSGDKPIYCSECFEQVSGGSSRRPERRDSGRRQFREKRMYHAVCDECGKDCEVPFKPTGGKPVFCDDCFRNESRSDRGRDRGRDDKKPQEQVDVISNKLDRIIQILESLTIAEKKPKKRISAKKTVSKKKKAKKPVKRKTKKTAKRKTKTKKVASKKK